MRKCILLLIAAAGIFFSASAQTKTRYRHISSSLNFGEAFHGKDKGPSFIWDLGYAFGNNRVAFRGQAAATTMRDYSSWGFTYDRFLYSDGLLRLSLGAGLGHYDASGAGGCSPGPTSIGNTVHTMNHFGGLVKANIKYGHLQLGVDYNIVPPTTASDIDASGKTTGTKEHANSYTNLYIGLVIGGGRRR